MSLRNRSKSAPPGLIVSALSMLVAVGALVVSVRGCDRIEEVERARLSVQLQLEQVDERYRLSGRLGFSGTTDALNVTVRTFSAYGPPIQRDYLFSHEVDWDESGVRHNLGDLSPSEKDRAIVTATLSLKQIEEMRAKVESLYYIIRID